LIDERDVKLAEALGIVVCVTIFLGFTVYYWGSAWILLGLITVGEPILPISRTASVKHLSSPLPSVRWSLAVEFIGIVEDLESAPAAERVGAARSLFSK